MECPIQVRKEYFFLAKECKYLDVMLGSKGLLGWKIDQLIGKASVVMQSLSNVVRRAKQEDKLHNLPVSVSWHLHLQTLNGKYLNSALLHY